MRDLFHWLGYFILVCLLLGWVEVGMTWMLCHSAFTPDYFWAILGIPMSFNMCLSFAWFGLGVKQ